MTQSHLIIDRSHYDLILNIKKAAPKNQKVTYATNLCNHHFAWSLPYYGQKIILLEQKDDFQAQLITLNEAYDAAIKAVKKIIDNDLDFDLVVGVARGGMAPARFVCDLLSINELIAIQVKHYGEGGNQKDSARVLTSTELDFKDKKVLLVDDINDSGESLRIALEQIKDAKVLKTLVLHEKNNTQFPADFVGEHIKKWRWCIYQWAATEDLTHFLSKNDMMDQPLEDMLQFLRKKYGLIIDQKLLSQVLLFKERYD